MQLTARWTGLLVVVVASLGRPICATQPASVKPRLVEVWRVGDDALTSRLRDKLESALETSRDFALSSGKKPGTLVVTIPTHVGWKRTSGGRTRVTYKVEFSSVNDQKIGTSIGSCWDDSLGKCAAQIVEEAKIAANKIP
jgi:hypothetical protein